MKKKPVKKPVKKKAPAKHNLSPSVLHHIEATWHALVILNDRIGTINDLEAKLNQIIKDMATLKVLVGLGKHTEVETSGNCPTPEYVEWKSKVEARGGNCPLNEPITTDWNC